MYDNDNSIVRKYYLTIVCMKMMIDSQDKNKCIGSHESKPTCMIKIPKVMHSLFPKHHITQRKLQTEDSTSPLWPQLRSNSGEGKQ